MPKDESRIESFVRDHWRLILVLAIGAALRIWVLAVTENGIDFHFNAYDRQLFVQFDWIPSGRFWPMLEYGPLHFFILRGAFALFGFDPIFIPRLISLIFGVATLWPLYRITKRNFGEGAAFFGGIAAAFYPLGVRLSAVSLEVTLFHFLIFLALDSLELAADRRNPSRRHLFIGALWLNLACATRFEGWLLIPLMSLLMLRAGFKRAVIYGAIVAVFPFFWMAVSQAVTGNALYFASVSAAVQKVHSHDLSIWIRLLGWPKVLLRTSTIPVILFIVCGLAVAAKQKKGLAPAVIGLGLFGIFIALAARGSMAFNETKYIATVGFALIPFAGFFIARVVPAKRGGTRIQVAFLLVGVAAFMSMAAIGRDNLRFKPPSEVRNLCNKLAQLDPEQGKVLIGVRFQGYILARSGLDYDRFVLVPGDDSTGRRSAADLWRILNEQAPCYLIHDVLPDRLDFQDILPIDGENIAEATVEGYNFKIEFQQGEWMLLRVTKASVSSSTP